MIRKWLPVCLLLASPVWGEDLHVPGLSPEPEQDGRTLGLAPCSNVQGNPDFCTRFLACFGNDGLWMDGFAQGWGGAGRLSGLRSDGVACLGSYRMGAVFGSATARFECSDGTDGGVLYYAQDDETGTGIARGADSTGRAIRAWTGNNVLEFLGEGNVNAAKLPCTDQTIPLS